MSDPASDLGRMIRASSRAREVSILLLRLHLEALVIPRLSCQPVDDRLAGDRESERLSQVLNLT